MGLLKIIVWSNLPARIRQSRARCPETCPGFWRSPRRRFQNFSGQPVPILHHLHSTELLPDVQRQLPLFQFLFCGLHGPSPWIYSMMKTRLYLKSSEKLSKIQISAMAKYGHIRLNLEERQAKKKCSGWKLSSGVFPRWTMIFLFHMCLLWYVRSSGSCVWPFQ